MKRVSKFKQNQDELYLDNDANNNGNDMVYDS